MSRVTDILMAELGIEYPEALKKSSIFNLVHEDDAREFIRQTSEHEDRVINRRRNVERDATR